MARWDLAIPLLLLAWTTAFAADNHSAHPFEECVLDHMRGVSSDAAALAVRQSCLEISSSEFPLATIIRMYDGMRGGYRPDHNSIYVTLANNTSLTITSITFSIEQKNDSHSTQYEVRDFYSLPDYLPPGAIAGVPIGDPLVGHIIRPGETKNFEFDSVLKVQQ